MSFFPLGKEEGRQKVCLSWNRNSLSLETGRENRSAPNSNDGWPLQPQSERNQSEKLEKYEG